MGSPVQIPIPYWKNDPVGENGKCPNNVGNHRIVFFKKTGAGSSPRVNTFPGRGALDPHISDSAVPILDPDPGSRSRSRVGFPIPGRVPDPVVDKRKDRSRPK